MTRCLVDLPSALVFSAALIVGACTAPGAGTYCQSGPKYGTSCYSAMDVQQPPGAAPPSIKPAELGQPPAPPQAKPWMPSIAYVPGASGVPVSLVPLPAALTCDGPPALIQPPPQDTAPPATAGQMSQQAADAKRLFDQEKWNEAIIAMGRVARGETGDDDGNKQLAEYWGAISLYRANRPAESYSQFSAIARRRNHLKHVETLLWLSRFAGTQPEFVNIADFASYDTEDLARFNNPNQRSVFDALNYLIGRERLQEGLRPQAREFLGRVPATHPYAPYARKCLAQGR